tara:strand:- start:5093 stop:6046 length:954 start_codon:yes stop_codon:yes gene_type:complete
MLKFFYLNPEIFKNYHYAQELWSILKSIKKSKCIKIVLSKDCKKKILENIESIKTKASLYVSDLKKAFFKILISAKKIIYLKKDLLEKENFYLDVNIENKIKKSKTKVFIISELDRVEDYIENAEEVYDSGIEIKKDSNKNDIKEIFIRSLYFSKIVEIYYKEGGFWKYFFPRGFLTSKENRINGKTILKPEPASRYIKEHKLGIEFFQDAINKIDKNIKIFIKPMCSPIKNDNYNKFLDSQKKPFNSSNNLKFYLERIFKNLLNINNIKFDLTSEEVKHKTVLKTDYFSCSFTMGLDFFYKDGKFKQNGNLIEFRK